MIQDDKAAAGGKRFKQFVVTPSPGGRLNSSVRLIDFTLGQAAETQVKQVSLVPQRQFLADCDAAVKVGPAAQKREVAGEFIMIGDGKVAGCRLSPRNSGRRFRRDRMSSGALRSTGA